MNNEIRNIKQEQFSHLLMLKDKNIMRSSIRFGKTKVGLMTIKPNEKVLIAYPRIAIKNSWLSDIKTFGVSSEDISYTTFASLHKLNKKFDYVIVDEFHKLSAKQIVSLFKLVNKRLLLMTGTLKFSKKKDWISRGIPITVEYDLENAINDKLVKDYRVIINFVELDSVERAEYDSFTRLIDWAKEEKEVAILTNDTNQIKKFDLIQKKYLGLRTNLLYNTNTTKEKAKQLIDSLKDEKVLIFALRTSVADTLSEKSFHSKSRDASVLEEFKLSEKGHMSTVNVINEGITIHNLNNIVCHTVTSNTEDFQQKIGRGLQLGEVDDEICNINLVAIANTVSEDWTEQACKSLNQEKIFYRKVDGGLISKIEYIKLINPDKELYLYEGSFCYKVSDTEYKFLGDKVDRSYSIPLRKLKKL